MFGDLAHVWDRVFCCQVGSFPFLMLLTELAVFVSGFSLYWFPDTVSLYKIWYLPYHFLLSSESTLITTVFFYWQLLTRTDRGAFSVTISRFPLSFCSCLPSFPSVLPFSQLNVILLFTLFTVNFTPLLLYTAGRFFTSIFTAESFP